jgi:hypothetical protein
MRSCSAKFRVVIPQAGAKTLLANLPAKPVIRLVCGLSLLFCVLLLTTGCGGSKRSVEHVNVTGKVTYNGKPVTGGQIMFVSKDGFASTGRIDENGNYTINAPLGEVKITVDNRMLQSQNPMAMKAREHKRAGRPGYSAEGEPIQGKYVEIPDKFTKAETTPLTWTVAKDQPSHDIDLK